MSPREIFALGNYLSPELKGRTISDARYTVSLTDRLAQAALIGRPEELAGRSVLLAVSDQLISALAMTEIDGLARRMLLCPPDLRPDHVRSLIEDAEIDAIVTDHPARQAFPNASVGHAYASTEAGVGFAVNDGREGFPADLIGQNSRGVETKVVDGSLRIRSKRTAHAHIGRNAAALLDADGYVDTGDMVELRGDSHHFVGRRGGIINIGGLKVHPEEIEAVINRHAEVRMSRAKSRRSPITGAIVVADVVLSSESDAGRGDAIKGEILADCRASLAPHKVPAMIRFVPALDVTAAGKLARSDAKSNA